MEHTPGKWEKVATPENEVFDQALIIGPNNELIATVHLPIAPVALSEREAEANACLISCAPAMSEAGHKLAMLALQSGRYTSDPEYRDAVDNWLTVEKLVKGGDV